jgi:hypothetical protein
MNVLCADWSKDPKKREVYAASAAEKRIGRLQPPTGGWSVANVFLETERLRPAGGPPVLVGFDAPIGVPRSFLDRTGARTFMTWLHSLGDPAVFEPVREPQDWSVARPFFIVPKGQGSRSAFEGRMRAEGAGSKRRIDVCAHANPVFIAGGIPGSVGASAIDLWRGLREVGNHVVWPFDGGWEQISKLDVPAVVGEIYPRLAYSLALSGSPHAERGPVAVAKTVHGVRAAFLDSLLRPDGWLARQGVKLEDAPAALASEDAFDAMVTAAGLLRCVLEGTPLSDPDFEDPIAEGGILGSGSVRLDRTEASFAPRLFGERRRDRQPATARDTEARSRLSCPIPGCAHAFLGSRRGWDAHVASLRNHPAWRTEVTVLEKRKQFFRADYPGFFR